jgi:hypothetical protein
MKEFIFTLTSLAVMMGVSSANASCYKDHDKFSGTTFQWCGSWGTGGVMLGGLNGLDPIPYHMVSKDGGERWYIKLISSQGSWSNIETGDKLVFLIDGELTELRINNRSDRNIDSSNQYSGVRAVESVTIPSSPEFFRKIAQAKNVEFALYTNKGRQERTLSNSAREHYADLLKEVEKN